MMRQAFAALLFLALGPLSSSGQDGTTSGPKKPAQASPPSVAPAHTYALDAGANIDRAVFEARKSGKRILLDIGGDWCPWCRSLDRLFEANPDLRRIRDENFITIPVYYDSENKNEQLLSRYSKVLGIPHWFVLDDTGALLHSQHMMKLQDNGQYSAEKMKDFLITWSRRGGKDGKRPL